MAHVLSLLVQHALAILLTFDAYCLCVHAYHANGNVTCTAFEFCAFIRFKAKQDGFIKPWTCIY